MPKNEDNEFRLTKLPNGWTVGRFPALEAMDGLVHLVTTREGPDVDLTREQPRRIAKELAEALGVSAVAFCRQVHGKKIVAAGGGGLMGRGDGLVSSGLSLGLMGFSADCPLILVADSVSGAIGLVHASWHGTVARIASELVMQMASRYGVEPKDLIACICPSVGPCCYEVGSDVVQAATIGLGLRAERFFENRAGKIFFDLWSANVDELERTGLELENIHTASLCTICHNDLFPSYRVEKQAAGRFIAAIGRL